MAKKNDFEKQDEQLQEVNEALSGAGRWIENHQKVITWVLAILFVGGLGYFGYRQFIVLPKKEAAKAATYQADNLGQNVWRDSTLTDEQKMRLIDSLRVYGDATQGVDGYKDIADDCSYQEGDLAALKAGISLYNLGNYQEAIDYLQRFEAEDVNIYPASRMLLGDTYVELGQYDEALEVYNEVIEKGHKVFAPRCLYKSGLVYLLRKNDKANALKAFTTIKSEYPTSVDAMQIDKYIAVVK